MIVDLEEKEESGWFDLGDGGRLHLRLLSADDLKEMRKACFSVKAEYPLLKTADGKEVYQRFEAQEFDADLFDEMKWDRIVIGWEKILDRNEKPIPVTKENKILLMQRVPKFAKAVDDGLLALKDAEKARTEQAEKNLLIGSSGKPNSPS